MICIHFPRVKKKKTLKNETFIVKYSILITTPTFLEFNDEIN